MMHGQTKINFKFNLFLSAFGQFSINPSKIFPICWFDKLLLSQYNYCYGLYKLLRYI